MKIYHVINKDTGYSEEFYDLPSAKWAMKVNDAKGFITKVWANGDFEPAGEITLKGTNKTYFANTKQKKASYC